MIRRNRKRIVICITATVLSLALIFVGGAVYVSDYYRADTGAIKAFSENCAVQSTHLSDGVISYGDEGSEIGFIFYPGGKVEYTAYEPLMLALASKGILCVLVEMPFHLAVLDVNAADGVRERFPAVKSWYIGGHSLGGSMAASYLAKHTEEFDGIVLLGSYSTADLSDKQLRALSIFGSEDLVMNREKYRRYRTNMPSEFTEIELDGGCHAYFGMYGRQEGDGEPAISAVEQIRMSAEHISLFLKGGE